MANSVALITKYFENPMNLNEVFNDADITADIAAKSNDIIFLGANSIKLKSISFGANGLGDYSRTGGYTALDSILTWTPITLDRDKGNKLMIDNMDIEEGATSIIEYGNEYVRTLVVPDEVLYRLNKFASGAGTRKIESNLGSSTYIEEQIDAGIAKLKSNNVAVKNGLILYMSQNAYTALVNSSKTSHSISIGSFAGSISKDIEMYRGCKIVEVPDEQMPDDVQFILLHPKAVWAVVKHNPSTFFASVPGYDGEELDYRMYSGAGVRPNRSIGVYASYLPAATVTLSALTFANATLSPTFAAGTETYTSSVASEVSATGAITATATDSDATVVIKKGTTVITSTGTTLATGANVFTITVTNDEAETSSAEKVYTVTITKAA